LQRLASFWVAQRFTAAIEDLFLKPAFSAEVSVPNRTEHLHQNIVSPSNDGMLHFLKIILNHIESINALFKMIR